MHITIVTPAKKNSTSGNRTTALRWDDLLKALGHDVEVVTSYDNQPTDLLIALHAWRSAAAVEAFRKHRPQAPLIVGLGGTDVNTFLKSDPETTLRTMGSADALIGLHNLIKEELPEHLHARYVTIYQSAKLLEIPKIFDENYFDISVIGHLREEKDPFRTALASEYLPESSRIRISHYGKATSDQWANEARELVARLPRYRWQGEVSREEIPEVYARSRAMVISSVQEGGANVVSEALVADVPIIASDIEGNTGLMGDDYEGYYPVGNEKALAQLLGKIETNPDFYESLQTYCRDRAREFTPLREQRAIAELVNRITA